LRSRSHCLRTSVQQAGREIITLTEELVGAFRAVCDKLGALHRQLRQQGLVENEGSHGNVLEPASPSSRKRPGPHVQCALEPAAGPGAVGHPAGIPGRHHGPGLRLRARPDGAALPAGPAQHPNEQSEPAVSCGRAGPLRAAFRQPAPQLARWQRVLVAGREPGVAEGAASGARSGGGVRMG
jgi:hypothetical protein